MAGWPGPNATCGQKCLHNWWVDIALVTTLLALGALSLLVICGVLSLGSATVPVLWTMVALEGVGIITVVVKMILRFCDCSDTTQPTEHSHPALTPEKVEELKKAADEFTREKSRTVPGFKELMGYGQVLVFLNNASFQTRPRDMWSEIEPTKEDFDYRPYLTEFFETNLPEYFGKKASDAS